MVNVVGYIRVSTVNQVKEGYSLGEQLDEILLLQLKIGKHRAAEKIGYKLGMMLQFSHE